MDMIIDMKMDINIDIRNAAIERRGMRELYVFMLLLLVPLSLLCGRSIVHQSI